MRILIVEDSEALRESLRAGLAREGFAVDAAGDGEAGARLARNNPYDVLVLDWMLPKLDGLGVLQALESLAERPRVLVLTARDRVEDRVRGLNAGADDYLVKPFAFEELLARVRALVRRRYAESSSSVEIGPLSVDVVARRATIASAVIDLTAREFALLEYLARRRGHTVTREEIEDHIYGVTKLPSSNAVDSAICILRAKLGPQGKDLIHTRRGQGYVLEERAP
ncbi:MAG: response regulator transcription factor [Planctomycetes bacterium]|nr:response regulator transcription factor [Planctomycetota bacterium]